MNVSVPYFECECGIQISVVVRGCNRDTTAVTLSYVLPSHCVRCSLKRVMGTNRIKRNWQLQMIDREMDAAMATANQEAAEQDYREFLEDLEEDRSYRNSVNIYFSESV